MSVFASGCSWPVPSPQLRSPNPSVKPVSSGRMSGAATIDKGSSTNAAQKGVYKPQRPSCATCQDWELQHAGARTRGRPGAGMSTFADLARCTAQPERYRFRSSHPTFVWLSSGMVYWRLVVWGTRLLGQHLSVRARCRDSLIFSYIIYQPFVSLPCLRQWSESFLVGTGDWGGGNMFYFPGRPNFFARVSTNRGFVCC